MKKQIGTRIKFSEVSLHCLFLTSKSGNSHCKFREHTLLLRVPKTLRKPCPLSPLLSPSILQLFPSPCLSSQVEISRYNFHPFSSLVDSSLCAPKNGWFSSHTRYLAGKKLFLASTSSSDASLDPLYKGG